MYASKLMMQSKKGYVEDDSLIFKRENEVWGANGSSAITINIPNVKTGENGFTYCGTLPLVTGWIAKVMNNGAYLYRGESGTILFRNYASSGNLTGTVQGGLDKQPYIAATLIGTAENNMLNLTLSAEGGEKVISSTTWTMTTADVDFRIANSERNKIIDLGLVYNRVLTDAELERNYKAFLQKHR